MSSIRNLAVGLPVRAGHVLVLDAADSVKGEVFHRAIGGGIEFGETAEIALRREFVEELGVTLDTVQLLGVVENIFEYEGQPGHEIVHVFAVESEQIDEIPFDAELHVLDEGSPVGWNRISSIDRPIYPTGAMEILLGPAFTKRSAVTAACEEARPLDGPLADTMSTRRVEGRLG